MNKHYEDTLYYLKRAGEHATLGVAETLEPVEAKARELTGREAEPEPGRLETLRTKVRALERRVEDGVGVAREKLEGHRSAE